MKSDLGKAVRIGGICITSYIVSYYMRNILSVLTPEMLATGLYTKEYIGLLSSLYFLVYAAGQLVNGIIGDIISPKKMVGTGLVLSGLASIMFVTLPYAWFQMLCFGVMGYGLSMLRGPLMKIIAENTLPKYARVICVCFSAASYSGAFIASFIALIFRWRAAFVASGIIAIIIAALAYTAISVLEKKGAINHKLAEKDKISGMLGVFKLDKFAFYMLVGIIVEIASASISIWVPTYLTEHLNFSMDSANFVFSIMSLIGVVAPFASLALLKIFGEKDIKIVMVAFLLAGLMFGGMVFAQNRWLNIALFILARVSTSCASAMLWSIYIPSLGASGKVSSANGILDCAGYIGASVASAVFGSVVDIISWNGVICIWSGIMLVGVLAAFITNLKHR